jgi:hypothetical protein
MNRDSSLLSQSSGKKRRRRGDSRKGKDKTKKKSGSSSSDASSEDEDDPRNTHNLLTEILAQNWYPKSMLAKRTVAGVVEAFTRIMDDLNDAVHSIVCGYIIRIHKYGLCNFVLLSFILFYFFF